VSRRVARPYAAALLKVVERQGTAALRAVESELATVAELFRREPNLLRTFEVPAVPPAKKRQLLQAIGKEFALRGEVQRLLAALEQHYRLRFLPDVVAMFGSLVDRREGLTRGTVELPVPPTPAQLAALGAALGTLLGVRVELDSKVDPDLLAGFVVRVGSQVFDGSLRTQVQRFARAGGRR